MDFYPPEFAHTPYGSNIAAECAPQVSDPSFTGILIRSAKSIYVFQGEKLVLPVCGYYQLDLAPLIKGASTHVHVRRKDIPQTAPLVGLVIEGGAASRVPRPSRDKPINPLDYEDQVTERYFYLDAQRYLPQQLAPGTYEIAVSYGPNISNVITVEIVRR